jgi:hypothetical protein
MLDGLETKRSSLVNYVFRLLTRGRMTVEQISGAAFAQEVAQLRARRFTAIVIVEMLGGEIGRLLYQKGRLVYAGQSDLEPEEALWKITSAIMESLCTIVPLNPDQGALGLAAVDGRLMNSGSLPTEINVILDQMSRRDFSGVMALESGNNVSIWQWDSGLVISSPEVVRDTERARMVQIAWVERELPEIIPREPQGSIRSTGERLMPQTVPQTAPTLGRTSSNAVAPRPAPNPNYRPLTSDELWRVFEDVMREEIGDRTDRIAALLQQQHGTEAPEFLLQSLTKQLERVAGLRAVNTFRARLK